MIPLFLLSIIYIISALFQSPNLAIALTTPLSVTGIISGSILYLLLSINISSNQREKLLFLIVIDAVIISLYLLVMYLDFIPKSVATPAGNLLSSAIFILSIGIYLAVRSFQIIIKKVHLSHLIKNYKLIFYIISLIIIIPAVISVSFHLLTDQKPIILPLQFGWMIFYKITQNLKLFLLGVGPTNFLTAFTLGRPAEFNQTPFWNVTFSSSSSFFLTLATEAGIIAALLYIFLLIESLFTAVKSYISGDLRFAAAVTVIFLLTTLLVLPGNLTVLILIFVLLAFISKKYKWLEIDLTKIKAFIYLIPMAIIILSAVIVYFSGRFFLAEIYFKKSLIVTQKNGGTIYDLQRKGLILNPYLDRYHVTFSQTSLALANALAAKKDLSDEDRQNIPKLVAQSIEEARTAVRLYPTSIVNWDNLSRTYSQLINFATGSAQWAIESESQKITLDPTSPNPRLSMGLLQLSLKDLPEAEKFLLQAVSLKPDLIPARFNLAKVYKEEQKYDQARKEFQKTKSLLPADSQDHKLIDAELEKLSTHLLVK